MTGTPDAAHWIDDNREALLEVTSSVARDLLPPGVFDDARPARPNEPGTLDVAIQSGYVFIREEWTGATSSGGWPALFREEMVFHHCALRVIVAADCTTQEIRERLTLVAQLERDPRPMELKGRELSDAMRMLDLEMDKAVRANQLEGAVETIYELIATLDPAEAVRVAPPSHLA